MLLVYPRFSGQSQKRQKLSYWKFSTEEPLAVHILRLNGINTNRSAIKVVR